VQQLKQAVTGADVLAEVYQAQTMNQMVAEILYPRRLAAAILAASGVTGLCLASIGLCGMMSYSLAQRVHEIGVRAALGARRADILTMAIGEGLKIALIGCAIGGALTYTAFRITGNMFAVRAVLDLPTFVVVPLILVVVVLIASYIPARRAARVDPMTALRVQ
jgi:putative ABC transport system permease protein